MERNGAANSVESFCGGEIWGFFWLGEKIEHAFASGERELEIGESLGNVGNRAVELVGILDEGLDVADGDFAANGKERNKRGRRRVLQRHSVCGTARRQPRGGHVYGSSLCRLFAFRRERIGRRAYLAGDSGYSKNIQLNAGRRKGDGCE